MGVFDRFYDKEKLVRKTIEIENDLCDKLKEKYNISVSKLINMAVRNAIDELS